MVERVNFVSLPVADQDRALDFYTHVLGLEVESDVELGEGWRWIFLRIPGAETLIQFARTSEISLTGIPAIALVSGDVDAEVAGLRERGATIRTEPAPAPWNAAVRFALIEDTEGNILLLQSSGGEGA